jgi:hypothetical protein
MLVRSPTEDMTLHERKIRWFAVFVAVLSCNSLLLTGCLRSAGRHDRHTKSWESGLESLVLEGHELHASLRTRQIDEPSRHLLPGALPPGNPHLSADAGFVEAIARGQSQGTLGREGIRSVLYALYVGEKELGFYGVEAESVAEANRRENAVRRIMAHNVGLGIARVYRAGLVLLVVWHDGVSPECWSSVNARVIERLNTAGSRSVD